MAPAPSPSRMATPIELAALARPAPLGAGAVPGADLSIDSLVDATPDSRDRFVDALRGLSIVVVVLWHWVFSVTHVTGAGSLSMPNPVGDIPAGWAVTWVLQIMPLFFVVGGFANLASFEALERSGNARWSRFAARRLTRLARPVAAFVALWAVGDTIARVGFGAPSVVEWGLVVFVPLWFIGAYSMVVALAPVTIALHRRTRGLAIVGLGAAIAVADLTRLRLGLEAAGVVTTALVWLFAHQLGYLWRDGTLTSWSLKARVGLMLAGLGTLAALTNLGVYSRSMVAVRGEATSNMFPTTACIAALAVFQLGLVLLVRPAAERALRRRSLWRAVVALNAVAMTVFCWHMTALVAVIGMWRAAGFELAARPTGAWWAQRPVWLLGPALVLAGLVAVFARVELPRRSDHRDRSAR